MGETTGISWTDATWNPWHGCHKVSGGCKFCYMFRDKKRYGQDPNTVVRSKTNFMAPLKWKDPRLIFTCSWSDWFIQEADEWREEAWEIIRQTPQHTYQILTKRIERAKGRIPIPHLPNVWLGVSVEDQQRADERIPLLLQTPAAVRFISAEPLLGPIDLTACGPLFEKLNSLQPHQEAVDAIAFEIRKALDWVIVGGESGSEARPMHPAWVRRIRDECIKLGIAFHFKQWGEWTPYTPPGSIRSQFKFQDGLLVHRTGKRAAGHILDGKEWKEFPL